MYQQDGSEYVRKTMIKIVDLWKKGSIKPVIDSVYALEDVAEAMQKMHDRKNIGKLVLDPSMEPKPKPATPAKSKAKDKKQNSEDKADKDKKAENGAEGDKKEDAAETKEGDEEAAAATNGDGGDAAAGGEKKATNGEATEAGKFSFTIDFI